MSLAHADAPRPLAPAVRDALAAQNARLPPSARRGEALDRLARGAAAVVTGQQVGLFLGPLYTIYKTATAIRLAQALSAVPVFWLQTEDHDLPEIASCGLPGATVALAASADERIAIAHRVLPDDIARCHAELRDELGALPHAAEHLARLERHYRAGVPWGRAFAGLLAELFDGLVFCDPRDPLLAPVAQAVHARALRDAEAIAAALPPAPIHVRPGAPLSFFHQGGAAGPRVRLEPAGGDAFAEAGGGRTHTRGELLALLEDDPLRFSTSALLRPVLQDTLLPTAAYVGGPAEVAYFAQLPPLYAAYDMAPPRIVQRARFRLIDAGSRRLLDRLGLEPSDSERSEDELLGRCRCADPDCPPPDVVTGRLLAAFDEAQAALAPAVTRAGPNLARELARTRGAVARSIGRLGAKYDRALSRRDRELVDAVRRLQAILHPGGAPQERRHGLPYFAARAGDTEVIARVLGAVDPFDPKLKDLPI